MNNNDWLMTNEAKTQITSIVNQNSYTVQYGLELSTNDAKQLVIARKDTLMEERRIEFGEGIINKLIRAFCDSPYIYQDNYVETLERLQSIFYQYKNETRDSLTDDELIKYMRDSFDDVCQGSLDYLEETILEDIARSIRINGERFLKESRKISIRRNSKDELL